MGDLNREKLIKQCILGNRKAQDLLYESHKSMVMGICIRYAKKRDDVDDMFQESFTRVFQYLEKIQDYNALASWIKRTTIHTAINFNAKYRRINESELIPELYVESLHYEHVISKMSNEELIRFINMMPDGCREVFNMYVIDGYKHREIAEMLGISESTSKSQLRNARLHLRENLKKIGIVRYEKAV